MKKIRIMLLFLSTFILLCSLANAELINGGFEDGLNGWILNSGIGNAVTGYSSTSLSLLPQEGSYFLQLEHSNMFPGDLTQSVTLNAGDVVSGWLASEVAGTSIAWISVEYDSSSERIWASSTGSTTWTYWNWMAPETNTYTLRLYALATGIPPAPIYSNLFVDNISVASVPIPEPASVLLLGSWMLGLAGLTRKLCKI